MLYLLLAQGAYFFLTGVWPLVHMPSFLAVTGPKTDLWLVRTVGLLITIIAVHLLLAGWRGNPSQETIVLAMGSALFLMAVDVWYVARGTIDRIYLLDAAAELVLLGLWIAALLFSADSVASVTTGANMAIPGAG